MFRFEGRCGIGLIQFANWALACGCVSETVLHANVDAGNGAKQATGDSDANDSGSASGEWQPAGQPVEGWPDYDCEEAGDGSEAVNVGFPSSIFSAGIYWYHERQVLQLWSDTVACVGADACGAGTYSTMYYFDSTGMSTALDGEIDGREGRWLGIHGPRDWTTTSDADGPRLLIELPNGSRVMTWDGAIPGAVEGAATLCVARASPIQFAGRVSTVVAAADTVWTGLGDGTRAVKLKAFFDVTFQAQDVVLGDSTDPHMATTAEAERRGCATGYPWAAVGLGYSSYETAWPWDQLSEPTRSDVFAAGLPCNWVP